MSVRARELIEQLLDDAPHSAAILSDWLGEHGAPRPVAPIADDRVTGSAVLAALLAVPRWGERDYLELAMELASGLVDLWETAHEDDRPRELLAEFRASVDEQRPLSRRHLFHLRDAMFEAKSGPRALAANHAGQALADMLRARDEPGQAAWFAGRGWLRAAMRNNTARAAAERILRLVADRLDALLDSA